MNSDPYGLPRFDHLRPGHDLVVFDPEVQGFRELTPEETSRLLHAIRMPAERVDEVPGHGARNVFECEGLDRAEQPELVGTDQEEAVIRKEFRQRAEAPLDLELDAAERAYLEERGLDRPGGITAALEPERVEHPVEIDDEAPEPQMEDPSTSSRGKRTGMDPGRATRTPGLENSPGRIGSHQSSRDAIGIDDEERER